MCGLDLSQFAEYCLIPGHMIIKLSTVLLEVALVQSGLLLEFGSLAPVMENVLFDSCGTKNFFGCYQVFTISTMKKHRAICCLRC